MKKFLKGLGAVIVALVLVMGGYFAGQRVQISSIISAMPKKTIEKLPESDKDAENTETTAEPAIPQNSDAELTEMGSEGRIITKSASSAADANCTVVDSATNTTSSEALTLYTSAQKDGKEFMWDDSNRWVVELNDGQGGYYTLYDERVSNGSVYFEVLERENGDKAVYVYTMTGAGTSVKRYVRTEAGFDEAVVFKSGAVNRTFTSVPQYR